jgi:hypothetical protein
MRTTTFTLAAVLIAGTAGLATGASACSDKTARVEGMQLAQATTTVQTPTKAKKKHMKQMNAPTTGQGAAEPGKIGDEANPASNLPGRTPGSSASPSSQRANPARNSSH